MPRDGAIPVTFRGRTLSDAIDGTNAPQGAMASLQNLIPDPGTRGVFVPRPAAVGVAGSGAGTPTDWGSFLWGEASWGGFGSVPGAAQLTALLTVGAMIYGMIACTSGPNAGTDVPFAYNYLTQAFQAISIPQGAAALPTTQGTTGDWVPPSMDQVGSRIMLAHPGFAGVSTGYYFGWLDVSGFSSDDVTGDTHTSTTIDTLASDVLQDGWMVGMTITDSAGDIPANTVITEIAANGLSVTISNAATGSNSGTTFTVSGGTESAPLYAAGNTNGNGLVAVPTCVAEFNGRAYFGVGSGTPYSDAGSPCQMTNATQVLSFGNGLNVTGLIGLPFSQSQGGTLQALLAFQGASNIVAITGDQATENLATNGIGVGIGTLAPNTLCQTPLGVAFVAPDGLRYIGFLGQVSDPIGAAGDGVAVPFQNVINPSRMAAAYNQDVIRISLQNGGAAGQPVQEYWFHVSRRAWSGPHTFPAALIEPLQLSTNSFIMAASGIDAELWRSDVLPSVSSSYTENGNPMACVWQTSLLPDNQEMVENATHEMTLGVQLPSSTTVAVTATNEAVVQLGTISLSTAEPAAPVWGEVNWGSFVWGGQQGYFAQYDLPWPSPLIYKQMQVQVNGNAAAGLAIGNLYFKRKPLGYRMQALSGVAVSGGQR